MLLFFFFNDTATTEIYTLSLHDALPISQSVGGLLEVHGASSVFLEPAIDARTERLPHGAGDDRAEITHALKDRKSTRLNSSHGYISYAVFCLKKKINNIESIVEHQ